MAFIFSTWAFSLEYLFMRNITRNKFWLEPNAHMLLCCPRKWYPRAPYKNTICSDNSSKCKTVIRNNNGTVIRNPCFGASLESQNEKLRWAGLLVIRNTAAMLSQWDTYYSSVSCFTLQHLKNFSTFNLMQMRSKAYTWLCCNAYFWDPFLFVNWFSISMIIE
jgi:hypothetical protein